MSSLSACVRTIPEQPAPPYPGPQLEHEACPMLPFVNEPRGHRSQDVPTAAIAPLYVSTPHAADKITI